LLIKDKENIIYIYIYIYIIFLKTLREFMMYLLIIIIISEWFYKIRIDEFFFYIVVVYIFVVFYVLLFYIVFIYRIFDLSFIFSCYFCYFLNRALRINITSNWKEQYKIVMRNGGRKRQSIVMIFEYSKQIKEMDVQVSKWRKGCYLLQEKLGSFVVIKHNIATFLLFFKESNILDSFVQ